MTRSDLVDVILEKIKETEDTDSLREWLDAFCCEIIDAYWSKHYTFKGSCALCGNSGVIFSKAIVESEPIKKKFFCICPNGQNLRKMGRVADNSHCPAEEN